MKVKIYKTKEEAIEAKAKEIAIDWETSGEIEEMAGCERIYAETIVHYTPLLGWHFNAKLAKNYH